MLGGKGRLAEGVSEINREMRGPSCFGPLWVRSAAFGDHQGHFWLRNALRDSGKPGGWQVNGCEGTQPCPSPRAAHSYPSRWRDTEALGARAADSTRALCEADPSMSPEDPLRCIWQIYFTPFNRLICCGSEMPCSRSRISGAARIQST